MVMVSPPPPKAFPAGRRGCSWGLSLDGDDPTLTVRSGLPAGFRLFGAMDFSFHGTQVTTLVRRASGHGACDPKSSRVPEVYSRSFESAV